MTCYQHRFTLTRLVLLMALFNDGGTTFTPPTFTVTCQSPTTLSIMSFNCEPGSSVYVLNCPVTNCTLPYIFLVVDIVNDCEPDLDDDADNNYSFKVINRQLSYFRPDTDFVFDGSCPLGTLVQNPSFPTAETITEVPVTAIFTPPVSIEITLNNVAVTSSTVGDTLVMTVGIDEPTKSEYSFDIAVDSCQANAITLITDGCPVGPLITNTFSTGAGGVGTRSVSFTSFMDPASPTSLVFSCDVTICDMTCPPPVCVRRKRDVQHTNVTGKPRQNVVEHLTVYPKYIPVSPNTGSHRFTHNLEDIKQHLKAIKHEQEHKDANDIEDAFFITTSVMIISLFVGVIGTLAYIKMSLSKLPNADWSTDEKRAM